MTRVLYFIEHIQYTRSFRKIEVVCRIKTLSGVRTLELHKNDNLSENSERFNQGKSLIGY